MPKPKTVTVENVEYLADDKGEIKLDGEEKIVYDPEKHGKEDKPAPKDGDKKKKVNAADADLEALAKVNPRVAKMLEEKREADQKIEDDRKAAEKAAEDDAAKQGEWQELAETRATKLEELEAKHEKQGDQLGKYVDSTKAILEQQLKSIPEDKQGLIPDDFSPRQKLEYISKNAKLLGAKTIAIDGAVPPNSDSDLGEEERLAKEVDELMKKGGERTHTENDLMVEKAKKLKALRAARNNKTE